MLKLSITRLIIKHNEKSFRSSLPTLDRFDKSKKPSHATVPLKMQQHLVQLLVIRIIMSTVHTVLPATFYLPTYSCWQRRQDWYTGCERYWRPFCDTNINLHKIFKNNNRLMKFSGIVYQYLDFTFSGWNRLKQQRPSLAWAWKGCRPSWWPPWGCCWRPPWWWWSGTGFFVRGSVNTSPRYATL